MCVCAIVAPPDRADGDFHTGAAIIIDTFTASAETKWCCACRCLRSTLTPTVQSALTMLLPHGADVGTGPEHSSARIERFLQLTNEPIAREDYNPNMHVVLPSTAAQYFQCVARWSPALIPQSAAAAARPLLPQAAHRLLAQGDAPTAGHLRPALRTDRGHDLPARARRRRHRRP